MVRDRVNRVVIRRREPAEAAPALADRCRRASQGHVHKARWQVAAGKMTEDQLIDRWGKMVVNGKHGNADDLLAWAKQRAIQNGLPPGDAYLAGI